MTHSWRGGGLAAATVLSGLAAIGGCALSSEAASFSKDNGKPSDAPSGASSSGGGERTAPAASGVTDPGVLSGTGVILVHAAKFLPFRLCFENAMDLPPQPDAAIMPEANVVGVEVGSVVRLEPIPSPGKIYVIRENILRPRTGSCRELFDDSTGTGLRENLDYQSVTAPVNEPLGQSQVHLLAISGCGGRAFLPPKTTDVGCGPDWDDLDGNLTAKVLPLVPRERPPSGVPVQLVHLSPSIAALPGAETLSVTFGELAQTGPLTKTVAQGTTFLQQAERQTLDVTEGDDSVYAKYGFRIDVTAPGGPTTTLRNQSLANVQELSSPRDLPGPYYKAGSSYALLLLGDPNATAPDGGSDPSYARRRVHLLAIPVVDPAKADAGAPDGGAPPTTAAKDGG